MWAEEKVTTVSIKCGSSNVALPWSSISCWLLMCYQHQQEGWRWTMTTHRWTENSLSSPSLLLLLFPFMFHQVIILNLHLPWILVPFLSCRLPVECVWTYCCYSVIYPVMLITYQLLVVVVVVMGGLGLVVVAVCLPAFIITWPIYSARRLADKAEITYIQCSECRQQSDVIRQVCKLIGWQQQFGEVGLFPPAIWLIKGHILLGLLWYSTVQVIHVLRDWDICHKD